MDNGTYDSYVFKNRRMTASRKRLSYVEGEFFLLFTKILFIVKQ